jgi:hypothetical protein
MPCFKAGESPTRNWYAPPRNDKSSGEGGGAAEAFEIEGRSGGWANLQAVGNRNSWKCYAKDPAASRHQRKGTRVNEANQYRDNIVQSG